MNYVPVDEFASTPLRERDDATVSGRVRLAGRDTAAALDALDGKKVGAASVCLRLTSAPVAQARPLLEELAGTSTSGRLHIHGTSQAIGAALRALPDRRCSCVVRLTAAALAKEPGNDRVAVTSLCVKVAGHGSDVAASVETLGGMVTSAHIVVKGDAQSVAQELGTRELSDVTSVVSGRVFLRGDVALGVLKRKQIHVASSLVHIWGSADGVRQWIRKSRVVSGVVKVQGTE